MNPFKESHVFIKAIAIWKYLLLLMSVLFGAHTLSLISTYAGFTGQVQKQQVGQVHGPQSTPVTATPTPGPKWGQLP